MRVFIVAVAIWLIFMAVVFAFNQLADAAPAVSLLSCSSTECKRVAVFNSAKDCDDASNALIKLMESYESVEKRVLVCVGGSRMRSKK